MKVLRIIGRLNVGGPARHVVWLTQGLQASGCETILVAGVVPTGEDDMNYFAESAGVKPVTVRQMSREISLNDAIAVWKLYRLMLRERPDIVHTHTAKAGTVGRVAGMMYRWLTPSALIGRPRACRFVHTYHGHVFHSYYGPFKTNIFLAIERGLARLATDRIVVVSEQQRREINERFRVGRQNQFSVVPLGLDLSQFGDYEKRRARLRHELRLSADVFLFAIIGRLTDVKNHEMFLRAAALLKEIVAADNNQRPIRFLIIGDGKQRAQLEAQAKELRLADDVMFLGTRKDPEVFYPAVDVVALTSHNEGTPLTLIEAMANARPVIATGVGGVVDLLGPEVSQQEGYTICRRGISVPAGDAEAFARGLQRLMKDDALRNQFGRDGSQFVAENYGKERLLRDISKLYAELLALETTVPEPTSAAQ
jgi:glycosyltransferase involved in cell wall biosynthesis